uniref:Uncharacterized protein n=1 Tax=Pyramimonas obovata TaxID=1411642 RepID=A0A7S0MTZ5_9CHLO|mmetsp:Transcript_10783/g.22475  ORF Transcript_10783/g.22475 Transcript_10783/m.22475 type:complete len:590 (+) Transcript_10783:183-1952(+)|eukprot:CAMPEP_0118934574 /NCGR_PEP_ID=MMETSP1169-20130426/13900_1 /TAXON_ID=36882 /ORGANISM="Pyramimonas obovata, Strain CCMP722" /LENGTH=589 /DNA_ID=CAMNT_0006877495 /DNA_START=183 /DNA_END=1952 /DNA_ORIENTATION=-
MQRSKSHGASRFREWSTFSGDMDDLFHYTTVKKSVIRDKRLGIIYRTGQVAVLIYIVFFSLLHEKNYLLCETPTARARVKPFWPSALSDHACEQAGTPRTGNLHQPTTVFQYRVDDRLMDTTTDYSYCTSRSSNSTQARHLPPVCSATNGTGSNSSGQICVLSDRCVELQTPDLLTVNNNNFFKMRMVTYELDEQTHTVVEQNTEAIETLFLKIQAEVTTAIFMEADLDDKYGGTFLTTRITYGNGTTLESCSSDSSPFGFGRAHWDIQSSCNDSAASMAMSRKCQFASDDEVSVPLRVLLESAEVDLTSTLAELDDRVSYLSAEHGLVKQCYDLSQTVFKFTEGNFADLQAAGYPDLLTLFFFGMQKSVFDTLNYTTFQEHLYASCQQQTLRTMGVSLLVSSYYGNMDGGLNSYSGSLVPTQLNSRISARARILEAMPELLSIDGNKALFYRSVDLAFAHTGQVCELSFFVLLLSVTTSLSLFAGITFFVDFVMLHLMPDRALYERDKFNVSEDYSDKLERIASQQDDDAAPPGSFQPGRSVRLGTPLSDDVTALADVEDNKLSPLQGKHAEDSGAAGQVELTLGVPQ